VQISLFKKKTRFKFEFINFFQMADDVMVLAVISWCGIIAHC